MSLRFAILCLIVLTAFSSNGQTELGSSLRFSTVMHAGYGRHVTGFSPGIYVMHGVDERFSLRFRLSYHGFKDREMNTNCNDCGSRIMTLRGNEISSGIVYEVMPNSRLFNLDIGSSLGVTHSYGDYTFYNTAWGYSAGQGKLDNTFAYYEPSLILNIAPIEQVQIRIETGFRLGWLVSSDRYSSHYGRIPQEAIKYAGVLEGVGWDLVISPPSLALGWLFNR